MAVFLCVCEFERPEGDVKEMVEKDFAAHLRKKESCRNRIDKYAENNRTIAEN